MVCFWLLTAIIACALAESAWAMGPSHSEMAKASAWAKAKFNSVADPPFSFVYDGKPSSKLLPRWKVQRSSKSLDKQRRKYNVTYTDPKTGLEARCVGVGYSDFPTIEWTVYFKNNGKSDTPILSDIMSLDTTFDGGSTYVLNHNNGTTIKRDDYQPLQTELKPAQPVRFAPPAGRPCGIVFPYFNLEYSGQGVIVVVGWPGQWSAEFVRDPADGVHVRAGQELTHLKLHPGEEIRTPLMVLQFWEGDRMRSQNIWRRWMIAHNLPRPGGKLPPVEIAACSSHQFGEMINANTQNQELFIDRYLEEKLPLDYWWMDAGWYPCQGNWGLTGTWEVDKTRFPTGLKAISDHAHAKGVKIIVWFEPERVTGGTWLYTQHPEWLLPNPGDPNGQKLLNLGNSEAREWLTNHIDNLLTREGIDLYRQDYNIDPLVYWKANDSEDRQGITENKYVVGYLAYWDELRRRHPNMLLDTCASGGHRNDLETLRRAVPLLRSDYIFDSVGNQCHSYGIWQWFPYTGTGFVNFDTYIFRSTMGPSTTLALDVRRTDLDYPLLRKLIGEWRGIADNYFGDFYPLTDYSLDETAWMGWQFDRPEAGKGIVQAFRRPQCTEETYQLKLRGLQPKANYKVTDVDRGCLCTAAGRELMEKGLTISISDKPGAALMTYERTTEN